MCNSQERSSIGRCNEPVPHPGVNMERLWMPTKRFTLQRVISHTNSAVWVRMTGVLDSKLAANSMQTLTCALDTCMVGKRQALSIDSQTARASASAAALANKGAWTNRHQNKVGDVSPLQADLLSPQPHGPRCCTAAASALDSACIGTSMLLGVFQWQTNIETKPRISKQNKCSAVKGGELKYRQIWLAV